MVKKPHPSTLIDPGETIGFLVNDRLVNAWGHPLDASEDSESDTEVVDETEEDDETEVGPYDAWTVAQLKQELTNRELKTTGKADALRARLEEDDETDEDSDQEDTEEE